MVPERQTDCMLQPQSRRTTLRRFQASANSCGVPGYRLRAPIVAVIALAMSACSFFQITPASGTPAPKPEKKPAAAEAPAKKPPTVSAPETKAAATVEKRAASSASDSAKRATARAATDSAKRVAAMESAAKATADSVKRAAAKVISDSTKRAAALAAEVRRAEREAQKKPASVPTVATPAVISAPPAARRREPVIEPPPAVEPPPVGSDSLGVARLTRAAALWNAVRLFQPSVAAQNAAWNNATIRRLTDIRSTRSTEQYAAALRDWVATLNDPLTRIETAKPPALPVQPPQTGASAVTVTVSAVLPPPVRGKKAMRVTDSTFVVTWPRNRSTVDSLVWQSLSDATRALRSAMSIVIDLRANPTTPDSTINAKAGASGLLSIAQLEVANNLASGPTIGPSVRRRVYEGWTDQRVGTATDAVAAVWRVSAPLSALTGTEQQFSAMRRIVLVADSTSDIPPALLGLVSARQATLVAASTVSDRALVPIAAVSLGDGLVATVRTGELLNADGSIGIQPDTLVWSSSATDSSPALKAALQIARGAANPRSVRAFTSNDNALLVHDNLTMQHYPIMGARLLGAFSLWGTLRAFHAYGDLYDENLDDALERVIPRFESARDADGYAAAVLDFVSVMDDAQGTASGPSLTQHIGAAAAPFRVRWIDGRAIVTQILGDAEARAAGIALGDEISSADGFPMPAYVNEHRHYGPSSNGWSRLRNIMDMVPRGPAGEASFRVRDTNGRERPITLTRTAPFLAAASGTERNALAVVRELPAGIGYIDLDRVSLRGVDSAFQVLANTRALILDARSSRSISSQLVSAFASRFALQPRVLTGTEATRVVVEPCVPPDNSSALSACVVQRRQVDNVITGDTSRRYRGRTVMLIDERTQGDLERLGLSLESAANTMFIGTPSAGASGHVAAMRIPGQLVVTFTDTELRHADGRQLQRIGLTPQVDARPTVKGIRAGADEILDRAQQYLVQLLDPAVKKKK